MDKGTMSNGFLNPELVGFLDCAENSELSDGAWLQCLVDAVEEWNKLKKTNLNPIDTINLYNRTCGMTEQP